MSKNIEITPQDLRIGNWVGIKAMDGAPCEIKGLDLLYLDVRLAGAERDAMLTYGEIEPIPLTDEIMEKCGFYHPMHDELWRHKPSCVDVLVVDGWDEYTKPWITVNDNFMFPSIHCRYLHELQNCYFAIMGEELEARL